MKGTILRLILLLVASTTVVNIVYTKFPYTIEGEDCEGAGKTFTDVYGKKIGGNFSGKGFAYLQVEAFSFNVTVPNDEMYQFNAKIAQILSKEGRLQTMSINGIDFQYTFPYYDTWTNFDLGIHRLKKGVNIIQFKPIYGYSLIDTITITKATFPDFANVPITLTDYKSTRVTQELHNFLGSVYGKKIISGQQEIYNGGNNGDYEKEFDYIHDLTGKYPAIRGYDFMYSNPLYDMKDGTTERIIEWVTKRGGIATASWTLSIPKDFENYKIGDKINMINTTYDTSSTFKTENTVVKGTKENDFWNIAIKALAEQLLKLQEANVPLIFRPLHEAEGNSNIDGTGAWHWWGKAGAKIYINIWKYLYDKLTKEYDIHNLIWAQTLYAWSPNSAQWYAGDDYVDLIGYDKYNTVYYRHDGKKSGPNLDAESSIFYNLLKFVNNKKMIAMSENDSIPSLNNLIVEHAAWLYFSTWYGTLILDEKINNKSDLKEIYNSEYCITLEDLPFLKK